MVVAAASAAPRFPVKFNAKTPLTKTGFKDASSDPAQITEWQRRFPNSNWGSPTGSISGFVVLDLDAQHPESIEWWQEQQDIHGPVDTREVATPSGGAHAYFHAPEGLALKSTASQIAPGVDTRADGGYVVIPPSTIDGTPYEIVNDVPIAPLPDWLLDIWPKVGERKRSATSPNSAYSPPVSLTETIVEKRRNVGLTSVAGYLWNQCGSVEELESKLLEHNQRFVQPPLDVEEVLAIARSVSRYSQARQAQCSDLSWEEIEGAVAANPAVINYVQETDHDALDTFEGAGAGRRRFINPTDHGAINKLRNRLNPIWMKTHHADQKMLDGAARCGHLPRHDCGDCGTKSSDANNHRWNCRARLHPLCMGTQMRRPLWKGQAELEAVCAEHGLAISKICLGPFDVGDDPFEWAPKIKGIDKQVHSWVRRLVERTDCPESIRTSFVGFGYDLYQGYLNLRLIVLGPAGVDDSEYLIKHFGEATERPVEVQKVHCRDAKDAVDTFGNLQSSAAIYSDALECTALMEGLKGSRLVQGRGRFRASKKTEDAPDSANVSNITEGETLLETNAEPPRPAGGKPPPKCPECGSAKVKFKGYSPGDWHKVRSGTTGQWYWRLEDADPGGGPGAGFQDFQQDVARAREERLASDEEVLLL